MSWNCQDISNFESFVINKDYDVHREIMFVVWTKLIIKFDTIPSKCTLNWE